MLAPLLKMSDKGPIVRRVYLRRTDIVENRPVLLMALLKVAQQGHGEIGKQGGEWDPIVVG